MPGPGTRTQPQMPHRTMPTPTVGTTRARTGPTALLAVLALLLPVAAAGNGWEHGSVPFPALLSALSAEDPGLRARAAESLGFRGQPEAVGPLLEAWAKPELLPEVRGAIVTALGRLGDPGALPALRDCLAGERDDRVRGGCAAALGAIGDEAALPDLFAVLEADSSVLVIAETVDALGGFSSAPAVERLAAIAAGPDPGLAARAVAALGRTGAAAAAAPVLAALDRAEGEQERAIAVEALGRLAVPEAADPLSRLLARSDDPALKIRIAVALGAIREGSARASLVALLDDPLPAVQWYALDSLAALGEAAVAPDFIAYAGGLAEARRAGRIEDWLADPHPALAALSLETRVLTLLAEMDAPSALDLFLDAAMPLEVPRGSGAGLALANGVYQLRRAGLLGLGYTRAPERAGAALRGAEGIGDPDPRLRAVALRSLAVLGAAGTVETALGGLRDGAAEMRWTAAMVLGRLGDRRAEPALIAALGDTHGEVRRQAAASLGFLGAVAARPALERLAREDPRAAVRAQAAASLRALAGG